MTFLPKLKLMVRYYSDTMNCVHHALWKRRGGRHARMLSL